MFYIRKNSPTIKIQEIKQLYALFSQYDYTSSHTSFQYNWFWIV